MRVLSYENSGDEYVQFRGYQSSVLVDSVGLRFRTEVRETHDSSVQSHIPVKVGDDGILPEMAELLVERNPMINYGVCCEHEVADGVCNEVFDTPKGLSSHESVHYDSDESDEEQETIEEKEDNGN